MQARNRYREMTIRGRCVMRYANSLNEVKLPEKHLKFLRVFLNGLSKLESVERVILFGSCARESAHNKSDIDLMIIGDNITDNDENTIYFECMPDVFSGYYVETDILLSTNDRYDQLKYEPGYVQRQIERFGVDLTKCLHDMRDGQFERV